MLREGYGLYRIIRELVRTVVGELRTLNVGDLQSVLPLEFMRGPHNIPLHNGVVVPDVSTPVPFRRSFKAFSEFNNTFSYL